MKKEKNVKMMSVMKNIMEKEDLPVNQLKMQKSQYKEEMMKLTRIRNVKTNNK